MNVLSEKLCLLFLKGNFSLYYIEDLLFKDREIVRKLGKSLGKFIPPIELEFPHELKRGDIFYNVSSIESEIEGALQFIPGSMFKSICTWREYVVVEIYDDESPDLHVISAQKLHYCVTFKVRELR